MPEVEGIGDMATGAALARAVEPQTGAVGGHTHEANCLNCGEPLVGPYCYRCGQRGHVHRTISAWWHDFLHSVLHVDGKFWLTLGLLAWRPGDLTRRYAHGERAKFISPLALFLFTVFLMFAVFSVAGPTLGNFSQGQAIELGLADERQQLEKLRQERQEIVSVGAPTAEVDARIRETENEIEMLETLRDRGITSVALGRADGGEVQGDPLFVEAYNKAKANPELLIYKMQANAYKFSWALIPISVPFVWILFLHRRRYRQELTAYDHLVFVTYSIAFMSLALIAFVLLGRLGAEGDAFGIAFLLVPPLHMYRQLRGAYGLSRWSAAWRTLALLIFAAVALTLFAMLLLLVGVAA